MAVKAIGGQLTSVDELMKNCDFVVVSAALNDETKFIVNRYRIGLMKPNAILVNIGRGGLYFVIKLFYCEITNNYYKKELKKII